MKRLLVWLYSVLLCLVVIVSHIGLTSYVLERAPIDRFLKTPALILEPNQADSLMSAFGNSLKLLVTQERPAEEFEEEVAANSRFTVFWVHAAILPFVVMIVVLMRQLARRAFRRRLTKLFVKPSKLERRLLWLVPILIFLGSWTIYSELYNQEKPGTKNVPRISSLAHGCHAVFVKKNLSDEYVLPQDVYWTLRRFTLGSLPLFFVIVLGLYMGRLPYLEATLLRFAIFIDKWQRALYIPFILLWLAMSEESKIMMVFVSAFTSVLLDTYYQSKKVPMEQIVSAKSIGFSDNAVITRIVLPQIMPGIWSMILLKLNDLMTFTIIAESMGAMFGVGFRTFEYKRSGEINMIIPEGIIMSLIVTGIATAIRFWIVKRHSWSERIA